MWGVDAALGASWAGRCHPGELRGRFWGIPASRGCSWDCGVQQLLKNPPCPAALGQEGSSCCPLGLLLWDAPAPSSSSAPRDPSLAVGKVFPPMCDYGRTAQPQPCRSADTRGGVPAGSQGTMWPLGLDPTPSHIHSGECQVAVKLCSPPVVQMSLAVMLNCWSAAGPDPTTTKSSNVSWLLTETLDQAWAQKAGASSTVLKWLVLQLIAIPNRGRLMVVLVPKNTAR